MRRLCGTAEATRALAREIAPSLRPGDILLLYGPLGAGKTEFVRGLAEGLEVRDRVSSPTYVLMNLYRGAPSLAHLDLYRIGGADLYELGVDDLEGAVVAVEWAERLGTPPPGALRVVIEMRDDARLITVEGLAAEGLTAEGPHPREGGTV